MKSILEINSANDAIQATNDILNHLDIKVHDDTLRVLRAVLYGSIVIARCYDNNEYSTWGAVAEIARSSQRDMIEPRLNTNINSFYYELLRVGQDICGQIDLWFMADSAVSIWLTNKHLLKNEAVKAEFTDALNVLVHKLNDEHFDVKQKIEKNFHSISVRV